MRTTFSESIHSIGLRSERSWDKCDNHAAIRVLVLLSPISADPLPKPGLPSSKDTTPTTWSEEQGQESKGTRGIYCRFGEVYRQRNCYWAHTAPECRIQNSEPRLQNGEEWRMASPECRGAPAARWYRPVPICIRRFRGVFFGAPGVSYLVLRF